MKGLTPAHLARACQLFLKHAYPQGAGTVPPLVAAFLTLDPAGPFEHLLRPPLCQSLPAPEGGVRGYALRLGCAGYPHLKLQVVACGAHPCVFAVDTHDALPIAADDPDAPRWAALRRANRQLKEQIERAWEAEGLCTLNALLRRELNGEPGA
jgi:hypothetical protein